MSRPKTKRQTRKRNPVGSSEIVSQHGPKPSDHAKRKLVDIWLEFDGNEAKAILEAFKIGFQDGVARAG